MADQADQKSQPNEGLPQHGPAQPAGRDRPSEPPAPRHTEGGAPTDAAHQDVGDGTLTGSVPAGLSRDELLERSQSDRSGGPAIG